MKKENGLDFVKRFRRRGPLALAVTAPIIVMALLIFTAGAALSQTTVFTDQVPSGEFNDGVSYELGMKFQSSVAGEITAIRHWQTSNESGTHIGRIWDATGKLLAMVEFTQPGTLPGWQQQALAQPLEIQPNTTYVVSVNINSHYPATVDGLASPIINGELRSVADGANGVFGDTGAFPTSSFNNLNYFRDVVFTAGGGEPTACIVGEKYVSVNGPGGPFVRNSITVDGGAVVPPENLNDLPGAIYGGTPVFYQFVIKNCGTVDLYNVRLDDCIDQRSVGDGGFLVGGANGNCVENPRLIPANPQRIVAAKLAPGESVTVTSADFPYDPISTIDICETFGRDRIEGIVRNDSEVEADADLDGDGYGETFVFFDDLNLVQCKEGGPAKLGDRVWKDLNGNGIQDCEDTNGNGIIGDTVNNVSDQGPECQAAGVPGVKVDLVECGNGTPLAPAQYTDADGFYLFENLIPGTYCVQFDLKTVPAGTCEFGLPQFTKKNAGDDDTLDSDANPLTGVTDPVILTEGETNLTVDAGIVCPGPAKLGDRVWKDLNGNGVQDCTDTNGNGIIGDAGDTGPECQDAGIPDVTVDLVNCDTGALLQTTTTDADGFYLFDNLKPGEYCVQFDLSTVPDGTCDFGSPQFTTQNAGDDAVDSDADPTTGLTQPVILAEGETNLTVDAGIVCQECNITIDKKCLVKPPVSENFVCSDAKPIDSLSMKWDGLQPIRIKAWKGSVGSTLLADIDNIEPGEEVTVTGFAGSPNDVYWEIFNAGTATKIGESTFHLSCSDDDMNGPEDCGKLEGDGKGKTGFINEWIFEGMAGNGLALDCTPTSVEGANSCEFVLSPPPSCESLDAKPTSLTFRYTGADCSASDNDQAADKWACSEVPGDDPVSITIVKDPSRITVSPNSGINVGDLITISAIGSDMGSEIQLYVGGQFLKIHTSCSQPLAAGDVFGSLELVRFNGQSAGAEVIYSYEVTNMGTSTVDVTSVNDNLLGELLASTTPLPAGKSIILEKTAFIDTTTTNEVIATANVPNTDIPCGKATDSVTVTVTEPTCDVSSVFDKLEDDKIKWKLTNTSAIVATLETLTVYFPDAYGAIKEVKLDGTIFKKDDSAVYPNGVPSGATIGQTVWTNPDVTKRQLDPGETRTLEVVFTQKAKEDWVNIDPVGSATFEETCAVLLRGPAGCEIGKPTALVFQYTGEGCVDGNDQAADKWSCGGDPGGASPIQVVMTKDADKFTVTPVGESIGLNSAFEIRKTDGGDFPSEIKFDIRQGGLPLQELKIHTSCSQPLAVGDQFGSVIVKEFIPKP